MFKQIALLFLFLVFTAAPTDARIPHLINFRSPSLYPESFTWDPKSDHFVVGSLRRPELISVSDAGVTSSLVHDSSLPPNSSFLGVAIDPRHRNRVLVVVHRSSPRFNALASYDSTTFRRLFLAPLDGLLPTAAVANDVAVDYAGNAYVTDSANDVIYKVTEQGEATILSQSRAFKSNPVDQGKFYSECGLNGVVYNSKGYLLVAQSNTGKIFKVDDEDGTARRVILNKDLTGADGVALRSDGAVLVVTPQKLYFIKSDDGWSEGVVYDETALDEEKQASAVAVGAQDRVYVLYGYINEGNTGNAEREEYGIVQVESEEEGKEEKVWIFVLLGLGMAYFLFWRFQMRKLMDKMNTKVD